MSAAVRAAVPFGTAGVVMVALAVVACAVLLLVVWPAAVRSKRADEAEVVERVGRLEPGGRVWHEANGLGTVTVRGASWFLTEVLFDAHPHPVTVPSCDLKPLTPDEARLIAARIAERRLRLAALIADAPRVNGSQHLRRLGPSDLERLSRLDELDGLTCRSTPREDRS